MPKIISLEEARARELKHYFTGRPCLSGHVVLRAVSGRVCCKCQYESHKKWNKENLQKKKESDKKWRKKNPQKEKSRHLLWRANNHEKRDAWQRAYGARNREKINERNRAWRLKNPERMKALNQRYALEGPQNPKGGLQWLRKNAAQLRQVRRLLKGMNPSPAVVAKSQNAASRTATSSPS